MSSHAAAVQSPDRVVFESGDVCVGEFRCPTDHPHFRNSGPCSHYCVVFPRTAVIIRQGNARIVADPNVATLYNRAQEYEREPLSPRGDLCEWYGVSPALLRDVLGARDPRAADDERRPIRFTHATVDARVYLAQRHLFRRVTDGTADTLCVEETIVGLLDAVLASAYGGGTPRGVPNGRARDLVHDTQCLLDRHATEPLGLSKIARAVGASMFHLCRCFRAGTGLTLHEYRTQLRLRGALEALESGDRDLTRVALDSGFSSHSHFTAAFRRVFAATPSRVRGKFKDDCSLVSSQETRRSGENRFTTNLLSPDLLNSCKETSSRDPAPGSPIYGARHSRSRTRGPSGSRSRRSRRR
jgi:AraC family transcriptional regulator